jgi:hypothetical protein
VKKQNDCSSLGGIKPQTNLAFIPHQIEDDYGVGIPAELAKMQTLEARAKSEPFAHLRLFNLQCMALDMQKAKNWDALDNFYVQGHPLKYKKAIAPLLRRSP